MECIESLLTGLISVQHHFLFYLDSLYIGVTPDPQVSAMFSVEPSGLWSIGPTHSASVSLQQAPWQHPTRIVSIDMYVCMCVHIHIYATVFISIFTETLDCLTKFIWQILFHPSWGRF